MEQDASIWFGAVLRGDEASIHVGARTNIQDGVIIHSDTGKHVVIGNDTTVGHGAIIHGCKIGDNVLIGMGAIVLDGAVIESGAFVAAGAMVGPRKCVPAAQVRKLGAESQDKILESAEHYRVQAVRYMQHKD